MARTKATKRQSKACGTKNAKVFQGRLEQGNNKRTTYLIDLVAQYKAKEIGKFACSKKHRNTLRISKLGKALQKNGSITEKSKLITSSSCVSKACSKPNTLPLKSIDIEGLSDLLANCIVVDHVRHRHQASETALQDGHNVNELDMAIRQLEGVML